MKGTLFAIGNDERSCYFIFRKEQKLLGLMRKMFASNDAYTDELVKEMVFKDYEAYGDVQNEKMKQKSILSMIDERYVFEDHGDIHTEIIFGNHKVFVNCRGKKNEISKIRKFARENFDFIKPK